MSALGAFLLVATLVALLLLAHHAKKKPRIRKKTDQFLAEVRANDPTAETRSAGVLPSRAVLNTIKPSNPQGAVSLPLNVLAVDVETTGLEADDRVVSLGIIMLNTARLAERKYDLHHNHFLFDPGKTSHPAARRVHGYRDEDLAGQEKFTDALPHIREMIGAADIIVAHNAEFDLGFINRELAACHEPRIAVPVFCTMQAWCDRMPGAASLNAAASRIGLMRMGDKHNAIEDAWLALMIYLYLHDAPIRPFSVLGTSSEPLNLRRPIGLDALKATAPEFGPMLSPAKETLKNAVG